ncbi:MAG: hypothetical protein M1818_005686 [Claussenomyces sp. TS43310]|nr:MAG: hypothetical protein M1818_005686 [Claussenomyces sp. TS43310]
MDQLSAQLRSVWKSTKPYLAVVKYISHSSSHHVNAEAETLRSGAGGIVYAAGTKSINGGGETGVPPGTTAETNQVHPTVGRERYSEGIDMLYSTTTFQFRTHELLRSLPQLILPQRFARLTSVELTWDLLPAQDPVYSARGQESYEALWGLLATMPELRALRIALRALPCPDPPPDGLRLAWLGPLEQLLRARRLETCELMVPRSYARHLRGGDGEELGFELGELDDIIAEVSCFAMGV